MYSTEKTREKVVLISIDKGGTGQRDLDELAQLVDTAGGVAVGRIIQKREAMHTGHYIGKGKLEEARALVEETGAEAICADDELTSSQQSNLFKKLGVRVLDRTMVILDIFAARAATAEGKAQVELAQYKYRLSHLKGIGESMSRQAGMAAHGGVGNRGPGEKKLELDRRHIRRRVEQLAGELAEIRENRGEARKRRQKNGVPVVALVGYTNAGKSTLMNALTGSDVFAEDKLFATLDTTTRKKALPGGQDALFTDTVGFIHKLPHTLIRAFHATLEELVFADVLLHVVDYSHDEYRKQMQVVEETLKELKIADKPIVTVLNKLDKLGDGGISELNGIDGPAARVSAKTGANIGSLLSRVEEALLDSCKKMALLVPYAEGAALAKIHGSCRVELSESREDGIYMEIVADKGMEEQMGKFSVPSPCS